MSACDDDDDGAAFIDDSAQGTRPRSRKKRLRRQRDEDEEEEEEEDVDDEQQEEEERDEEKMQSEPSDIASEQDGDDSRQQQRPRAQQWRRAASPLPAELTAVRTSASVALLYITHKIAVEVGTDKGADFSRPMLSAVRDFAVACMETMAKDVELFAKHGKRTMGRQRRTHLSACLLRSHSHLRLSLASFSECRGRDAAREEECLNGQQTLLTC